MHLLINWFLFNAVYMPQIIHDNSLLHYVLVGVGNSKNVA
jgi:hypothetical protein